MKSYVAFAALAIIVTSVVIPIPSHALSCIAVEDYLKTTIGNEDIVIFTATTKSTITKDNYTAEALTVSKSHQGYVENELMVYHQKDATWGYFCNNGPKGDETTGVYIAERDAMGMYQVTQRLDTKDSIVATFLKQLESEKATGEVITLTKEERIARIYSSINDLFATLGKLLGELTYWSSTK